MPSSWDRYLNEQLQDPRVRRAFEEEARILNVGQALAGARKKRGLTQEQIARRIGTSAPQLSRTERRPEHATLRTLWRYADAVGMEIRFTLRPSRSTKPRPSKAGRTR
jgi:transcriptional regulator with XRE-family HTH domain